MKKILLVIGIVAGWAAMQTVEATAQSQSTDKWKKSLGALKISLGYTF